MYYAGIGSRSVPEVYYGLFIRVGKFLATKGLTLRSGGAKGSDKAFEIAEKYHPYFQNLSEDIKKLHARNSHQVLGKDLNTPASFIICYTPKGKGTGGTGQALRIAKDYNIPIFDAGKYEDIDKCRYELFEFLKPFIE